MEIIFWGVRGSYPVPGPGTVRYGGHTSCVEILGRGGDRLILDAGSGLRGLGRKLLREGGGRPARHHIVMSHVHWDHILGLPYFEPVYQQGARISIYAIRNAAEELKEVIDGITRREFFPVSLEAAPAEFDFHEVVPGKPFRIDDFSLRPFSLNHPFGAVGYRIDADGERVAYVSDTAPFTDMLFKQHYLAGPEKPTEDDLAQLKERQSALRDAIRGADTVIHDTQFLPGEYAKNPHYGHSTPDQAIEHCRGLGIRRLVMYHHGPGYTDEAMDGIVSVYVKRGEQAGLEVVAAREGTSLATGNGGAS